MRFPHLPIGQSFSYQGKNYTKTGPLTASEDGTGKSQLIMKSAEVTLLGNSDQPAAEQQHQYSRQEVVEILTRYRRDLGKAVKARAGEQVSLSVVEMLELIETQAPSFD